MIIIVYCNWIIRFLYFWINIYICLEEHVFLFVRTCSIKMWIYFSKNFKCFYVLNVPCNQMDQMGLLADEGRRALPLAACRVPLKETWPQRDFKIQRTKIVVQQIKLVCLINKGRFVLSIPFGFVCGWRPPSFSVCNSPCSFKVQRVVDRHLDPKYFQGSANQHRIIDQHKSCGSYRGHMGWPCWKPPSLAVYTFPCICSVKSAPLTIGRERSS